MTPARPACLVLRGLLLGSASFVAALPLSFARQFVLADVLRFIQRNCFRLGIFAHGSPHLKHFLPIGYFVICTSKTGPVLRAWVLRIDWGGQVLRLPIFPIPSHISTPCGSRGAKRSSHFSPTN